MTQALYRKWRPLAWDEVVSQEHVIQTLKNAVAGDHVAHAYLFSGPRGTGKTTAARLLAKAVNCLAEDKSRRPCNECAHCVAVNESRFMDVIEIDAASNNGVDDVRELREKINFSPSQGRYKVYIVDEVHMLSKPAFNALLKTLEEPPPHAIFILATTESHNIPATVLSRCQRHEFRRFPLGEIIRRLEEICKTENILADAEALSLIARQSSGGMRDAISLLDQLASTGGQVTLATAQSVLGTTTSQAVINLIEAIAARQPASAMNEIHQALDAGADVRTLARQVIEYLRQVLLVQLGNGDQLEATPDVRTQIVAHAQVLPTHELVRMMRAFNAAAIDARGGWAPSLGLELAVAELIEQPQLPIETGSAPRPVPRPAPTQPVTRQSPAKAAESAPEEPGISLENITRVWKQISNLVKQQDPKSAASGLVNSGKPLEIQNGVLQVGFVGNLLPEKFNRPEITQPVEKAMKELLGVSIPVQGFDMGGKNTLPAHVKPDGMVATALQNGGEIVDTQ